MNAALWLGTAGLTLVAGALTALHRRRTRARAAALGAGMILLFPGVLGLTLQKILVGYDPLQAEPAVATIQFTQTGPQHFEAALRFPGGALSALSIHGDEWQIDARILTWQGWIDWLGMEPLYRFERLSGRYAAIDDEREKPRSVHALYPETDGWWEDWIKHGTRVPGADAYYGSAAYLPMADEAGYRISVSASGLVVRPDNPAAERAVRAWGIQPP